MAATIRVARGNKAAKGGLLYGELFWQKTDTGEEGTLYIGKPDGGSAEDLAIGGARAMQSLYYRGQHSGSAFPADAKEGDFWVMSANGSGSLADYKQNDWVVCIGPSQFTRVNNSGGLATEISFDNSSTNFDATTVDSALRELEGEKLQYIRTLMASNEVPVTPVIGGFYLIGADGVTIDATAYKKGDFAYFDSNDWIRIPSGFSDASDIDFDSSAATRPIGTPIISSNVQDALVDIYANKADLDGTGKVPLSQLPSTTLGALQYQGTYDASGGTYPTAEQGDYYVVNVAGEISTDTDSGPVAVQYDVGDWMVFDGTYWSKIDNTEKLSGLVVKGSNVTGTPTIQGSNKIDVNAAGGIITVSGQNLVDKSGATTPDSVPKFTADGTIGDSHITDTGTEVQVDADFTVGEQGTLIPKETKIYGPINVEPTGVAGEKTDHSVNFGSEQGSGVTRYAKVQAPSTMAADAEITLPDQDSTLVGQKQPTTPNKVTKVDEDGYIADSNITDDGTAVSVDAPLQANQGLETTDVDITDGNGNKVNIEAPTDLTGDIAITLPSESGKLATEAQAQQIADGATGALNQAVDGTAGTMPLFTEQHKIGDSIVTQKGDDSGIEVDGTVQAKAGALITNSAGTATATLDASALGINVTQTIPSHSGTLLNDNSEVDGGEY